MAAVAYGIFIFRPKIQQYTRWNSLSNLILFFPARCQMHNSTGWLAFDSTDSSAFVFNLWFLDPCNSLHSGYGPGAWKRYQWTGSSEKRKPSSSSSACFPVQLAVTLLPSLPLCLFLSLTHTQVLALFSQRRSASVSLLNAWPCINGDLGVRQHLCVFV